MGQWAGMFNIKVAPERRRKPEAEILEEAAERVARDCIRPQPRLPSLLNTKERSLDGGLLPVVHCAFAECNWELTLADMPLDTAQNNTPDIETTFREDVEHPCDQRLKRHILTEHKAHTPYLRTNMRGTATYEKNVGIIFKKEPRQRPLLQISTIF
jgi:hypothetical protein